MAIISNTTTLSNFASIRQLALLKQLFPLLYIPTAVYDEIYNGLQEGYAFYQDLLPQIYPANQATDGWIYLTTIADNHELHTLNTWPKRLHKGEAECLTIASHRHWLLLTDDRAARSVAREHDIHLSGTLGCLVDAVEQNYCSLAEANQHLAHMIRHGYRSPLLDISPLLGP